MTIGELCRVLGRVTRDDNGCWVFEGRKRTGYGRVKHRQRTWTLHRLMYEVLVAPIPDGLQLDHLCRNRACCNPRHLEPVTCQENIRRGKAHNVKTHCIRGHEFDEENTYITPKNERRCKECANRRGREYYSMRKVAA